MHELRGSHLLLSCLLGQSTSQANSSFSSSVGPQGTWTQKQGLWGTGIQMASFSLALSFLSGGAVLEWPWRAGPGLGFPGHLLLPSDQYLHHVCQVLHSGCGPRVQRGHPLATTATHTISF